MRPPFRVVLAASAWLGLASPALALNIIGGPADAPSAPHVKDPWQILPGLGAKSTGPAGGVTPGTGGVDDPKPHHNPEPASLVLGLVGAGAASLWGVRRGRRTA